MTSTVRCVLLIAFTFTGVMLYVYSQHSSMYGVYPMPTPHQAAQEKVLMIGIDGLRGDAVRIFDMPQLDA